MEEVKEVLISSSVAVGGQWRREPCEVSSGLANHPEDYTHRGSLGLIWDGESHHHRTCYPRVQGSGGRRAIFVCGADYTMYICV